MSSHYLQIKFKIRNITIKMSSLPFKSHTQLLVFLAVFACLPPTLDVWLLLSFCMILLKEPHF